MRGRTALARAIDEQLGPASMRPPQNAGENQSDHGRAAAQVRASMRPPQNAGENLLWHQHGFRVDAASMRPPQNAGENDIIDIRLALRVEASMRPPQNAGENGLDRGLRNTSTTRFNEAPAKCGGEPTR